MSTDQLTCIIVDDDAACIKITEALVKRTPMLGLAAVFSDPFMAADYLSQNAVDLIFLDIEMPGITGLELASSLKAHQAIIVISSKKEYAIDAFDLNVVDYLVKPMTDYARFLQAVMKVRAIRQKKETPSAPAPGSIFIKADSVLHQLMLTDILWVEASADYIKVHTIDKMLVALSTMKTIETKLPEGLFARVHRSYIVNLQRIERIDLASIYIGSKSIPIGNIYRESMMMKVNLL
jgi:DNA-binding LytR/AlgR family response regulator